MQKSIGLESFARFALCHSHLIVLPISARWHRWFDLSIETKACKTVFEEFLSDLIPSWQMPQYRLEELLTQLRIAVRIFSKLFIIEGYCKLSRIIATSLRSWLMLQVCSSLYENHKVYSLFIEIVLNLMSLQR